MGPGSTPSSPTSTRRTMSIRQAADALRGADSIVTVGHVAPDADALGTAVAMARSARLAGKEAVASFGEPFVIPRTFAFLDLDVLIPPGECPESPELMVAFDSASMSRLGSLQRAAERAGTLIVIDHHASNTGFGDISIVDAEAAASGQLAYELITELGWPVDAGVATALWAAVVADTGRFQYSNTSPGVLRVAAELVEAGARPDVIGQELYEKVPYGYLKVASRVLGRAELAGPLVWSVLTHEDLAAGGIGYEDADPLIDQLRLTTEAEATLLLKETDAGFKGSLRSRGRLDVGAAAVALGGGGHHNAAGFDHPGPVVDVVTEVARLLGD
jgi:phosphoesterase RecJ-like protein